MVADSQPITNPPNTNRMSWNRGPGAVTAATTSRTAQTMPTATL
jgi:hypothetical protein